MAFTALYRGHYAAVYAVIDRRVKSPQVAEELAQELFLAIWAQRAQHDSLVPSAAYVYAAARRRALGHLRRCRVADHWAECAPEAVDAAVVAAVRAPDAALLERDTAAALTDCVASLPPRRREVFRLRCYEHLSHSEIACRLGISVATVEHQMWLALRALRARLLAPLLLATAGGLASPAGGCLHAAVDCYMLGYIPG